MKKYILAIIFCLVSLTSFEQVPLSFKSIKYNTSSEIAQQIKKYPYSDSGTLKKSMDIEVTWDGKTYFNQKALSCFTSSFLRNDTIYITGYMLGQVGWGFHLALFGDSCLVGSFALSDGNMYKYNISDLESISFIELPTETQKLTLSRKPKFNDGERIEGLVELKSKEFYYISDKTNIKSNIKITAYFKTSMLKN